MLLRLIDNADKIGVIGHIGPDADSLGSVTGLAQSLRLYGKDVIAISQDPVPEYLEFLYKSEEITGHIDDKIDLLFMMDTSTYDRLGIGRKILENNPKTVLIDHHITNKMEADLIYLKTDASSTGEILFKVLRDNNLPIDENVANSILTAVSGDTGSFRYDNVSEETFLIASELLSLGADLNLVNNGLYGSDRFQKLQMLNKAIDRLRFDKETGVAISYVTRSDFEEVDGVVADLEGIVEIIRDLKGVEISILMRPGKDGKIKCSTRSKNDYDVRKLAEKFGGGGHIKAAGFELDKGSFEDGIDKILEAI